MSNNLRRPKPNLVFLANDLLNGFPCWIASVHGSAVVISWVFLSPSDHSLLLSMISVGDVPVFGVQRESVRCNSLQTTTKLTWSTTCWVLFFSPSSSLLFRFASWLKSFSQTWDGPILVERLSVLGQGTGLRSKSFETTKTVLGRTLIVGGGVVDV